MWIGFYLSRIKDIKNIIITLGNSDYAVLYKKVDLYNFRLLDTKDVSDLPNWTQFMRRELPTN